MRGRHLLSLRRGEENTVCRDKVMYRAMIRSEHQPNSPTASQFRIQTEVRERI